MGTNEIVKLETIDVLDDETGPATGIRISINGDDPSQTESFIADVVDKFLVHRTSSPPQTSFLVITLDGKMRPEIFAHFWKNQMSENQALSAYMSEMSDAEVVWTAPDGNPLAVSLLDKPDREKGAEDDEDE